MLTVSTRLFLVLISSVISSALENNYNSKILASESYTYNHPPSFEPYNVPDTNDFQARKSRNVEITQNIKNDQFRVPDTISKPDSIVDSLSLGSNAEKLHSDDRSHVGTANKKVKRRTLVRNQNSLNEANGAVKQALPYLDETRDSFTIQPVSTSPSPKTVVPKTFTKRPFQYNPVTKKTWENTQTPVVKILEETNRVFSHNGNFHYSYEGADGTKVSSVGELKSFNDDTAGEAVAGEVHYTDTEGNDFSLSYTADENGYRAYGAHLPTPPPIPPAIARALKYLATKSTPEPVTDATSYYY